MRNYTNDWLALLIDFCKASVEADNLNIPTVENIVVILCVVTKYIQKGTAAVFEELMRSEYGNYVATFAMEMLQDLNLVEVKARMVFQEEQFEEYSYRVTSGSGTIVGQEYLELFGKRMYVDDSKTNEYIQSAKNRLASGAVYLIGVTFTLHSNRRFWC